MTADATAQPRVAPQRSGEHRFLLPGARASAPRFEVLICHDFKDEDTLAALDRLPPEETPASLRFLLNTISPGVRYAIEAGMQVGRPSRRHDDGGRLRRRPVD